VPYTVLTSALIILTRALCVEVKANTCLTLHPPPPQTMFKLDDGREVSVVQYYHATCKLGHATCKLGVKF
jgi:hypothetical protein